MNILVWLVVGGLLGWAASALMRTQEGNESNFSLPSLLVSFLGAVVLLVVAIFNEPGLKVSEVQVETFKGVVQLSGFVSSRDDIKGAVRVASAVNGVKSVTNDMQLE